MGAHVDRLDRKVGLPVRSRRWSPALIVGVLLAAVVSLLMSVSLLVESPMGRPALPGVGPAVPPTSVSSTR